MTPDTALITEHMEVISSDDRHIGKVDHVLGTEIELSKWDVAGLGKHHLIPLSWVDWVDEKVHLNLTHDEAKANWTEKH
jgi:hypothetical protein